MPMSLGIGLGLSRWPKGAGFSPSSLFAGGEQGFLHNFRDAQNMRQDSVGTTDATTGQPVGLAIDESKFGGKSTTQFIADQPNLISNGDNEAGTFEGRTTTQRGVVTQSSEQAQAGSFAAKYTCNDGAAGDHYTTIKAIPANTPIAIELWIYNPSGNFNTIQLIDTSDGSWSAGATTVKDQWVIIKAFRGAKATIWSLGCGAGGAVAGLGLIYFIDTITVRAVPGYPASQATGAARPNFNAGLFLRPDASDDNLLSTALAGASGNTLAVRITAPATVAATQVIAGLQASTSTRWYLAIDTNGKLCAGVGTDAITTVLGTTDIRGQSGTAVLVTNGTTVTLYWKGVQEYTGAQAGSISTTIPYRIGGLNNNGTAANFTAADLYNALAIQRALTPAEILSLTNSWN